MTPTLSGDEKSRLARRLRILMPVRTAEPDETLSNAKAAEFMGGISKRTLTRVAYPKDLDGPVPIRYSERGDLFWSKRELAAYKIRRQIRLETNLMDGFEKRSLLTDLMDF